MLAGWLSGWLARRLLGRLACLLAGCWLAGLEGGRWDGGLSRRPTRTTLWRGRRTKCLNFTGCACACMILCVPQWSCAAKVYLVPGTRVRRTMRRRMFFQSTLFQPELRGSIIARPQSISKLPALPNSFARLRKKQCYDSPHFML